MCRRSEGYKITQSRGPQGPRPTRAQGPRAQGSRQSRPTQAPPRPQSQGPGPQATGPKAAGPRPHGPSPSPGPGPGPAGPKAQAQAPGPRPMGAPRRCKAPAEGAQGPRQSRPRLEPKFAKMNLERFVKLNLFQTQSKIPHNQCCNSAGRVHTSKSTSHASRWPVLTKKKSRVAPRHQPRSARAMFNEKHLPWCLP